MEATKEQEAARLLNKIIPPRIEDAGLEDCALPPESIKEAFLKAATAVKSRATSIFTSTSDDEEEEEGEERPNCINGPVSPSPELSDTLVVVAGDSACPEVSGPCGVEKNGGLVEEGEDKVVVVGSGDDVEEREGEKKCCVDGLKGLKIKEKVKNSGGEKKTHFD